jgi:hypothetical protein
MNKSASFLKSASYTDLKGSKTGFFKSNAKELQ